MPVTAQVTYENRSYHVQFIMISPCNGSYLTYLIANTITSIAFTSSILDLTFFCRTNKVTEASERQSMLINTN